MMSHQSLVTIWWPIYNKTIEIIKLIELFEIELCLFFNELGKMNLIVVYTVAQFG